jgi:type I restriction enzyme, S subunit
LSAEELFNLNPPITKRVYASLVENPNEYFLEPGWIVMARSGQIYGLNGSVCLVTSRHARSFVSEDLIRIAPRTDLVRPGYLLAVLGHPTLGRPLVIRHAYGTSIPHLEPGDVETIQVPRFDRKQEDAIADLVEEAARLRAAADDLEDKITARADKTVELFLQGEANSAVLQG